MYYKINAIDSWFFRNSAPFDIGINMNGDSIFPPFPSVYAGALKKCTLPLPEPNRKKNTFARCLKINWNGVLLDNNALFPLPLDLIISAKQTNTSTLLSLYRGNELILKSAKGSSYPLKYFLISQNHNGKPAYIKGGAFLDSININSYLNAEKEDYSICELGNFFYKDTHIGTQIDRISGKSIDGQMYQQSFIYPNKNGHSCSLAVEASGISLPQESVIHIGGERKLSIIKYIDKKLPILDIPHIRKNFFKFYLATPAIFEKGWLPGWIDTTNMTGTFTYKHSKVRVKLLSAAIGKSIAIGGFGFINPQKSIPKKMNYAVPAGSIYYFKLLEGTEKDVIKLFHKKCISDYRENLGFKYARWDRLRYCNRGFGYCLVGKISERQGVNIYHDL